MQPLPTADTDSLWWVQARDCVYGPYDSVQIAAFKKEGRITPRTIVASDPKGPWKAAVETALFAKANTPDIVSQDANLFIWGDIPSGGGEAFEETLSALGSVARLSQGLWLMRTAQSASSVRAAVAPFLRPGDRLLVADASRNRLAWSNLGMEAESLIRGVWKGA
jgi:hypothetical protein